ncbi:MAG: hypothetical protein AAFX06_18960, partial [Planctomycetota bacterium]
MSPFETPFSQVFGFRRFATASLRNRGGEGLDWGGGFAKGRTDRASRQVKWEVQRMGYRDELANGIR